MADEQAIRGVLDGSRIAINQRRDVEYWARAFDVDEATLREVVAEVGAQVEDVRQHLDGMRRARRRSEIAGHSSRRTKG